LCLCLRVHPGCCLVVNVNVNELRLGFSNTTRNPEGILSHNNRKSCVGAVAFAGRFVSPTSVLWAVFCDGWVARPSHRVPLCVHGSGRIVSLICCHTIWWRLRRRVQRALWLCCVALVMAGVGRPQRRRRPRKAAEARPARVRFILRPHAHLLPVHSSVLAAIAHCIVDVRSSVFPCPSSLLGAGWCCSRPRRHPRCQATSRRGYPTAWRALASGPPHGLMAAGVALRSPLRPPRLPPRLTRVVRQVWARPQQRAERKVGVWGVWCGWVHVLCA
jgi:hypothetical protein